jgi:hypothetical protein
VVEARWHQVRPVVLRRTPGPRHAPRRWSHKSCTWPSSLSAATAAVVDDDDVLQHDFPVQHLLDSGEDLHASRRCTPCPCWTVGPRCGTEACTPLVGFTLPRNAVTTKQFPVDASVNMVRRVPTMLGWSRHMARATTSGRTSGPVFTSSPCLLSLVTLKIQWLKFSHFI